MVKPAQQCLQWYVIVKHSKCSYSSLSTHHNALELQVLSKLLPKCVFHCRKYSTLHSRKTNICLRWKPGRPNKFQIIVETVGNQQQVAPWFSYTRQWCKRSRKDNMHHSTFCMRSSVQNASAWQRENGDRQGKGSTSFLQLAENYSLQSSRSKLNEMNVSPVVISQLWQKIHYFHIFMLQILTTICITHDLAHSAVKALVITIQSTSWVLINE
jgi:hypothetical protein